jgi:alpha,alpha-trehalase
MEIKLYGIQAAILDMDGVITDTAVVHQKAWKEMFDGYLKSKDKDFQPFTRDDYLKYVDGKPRYSGVESFLQSRKIAIPYGDPQDATTKETVCGLGNKKNQLFLEIIEKEGVEVFQDTIEQVKVWREHGVKTAVISSSKNCKPILEKAGVLDLFDARVDGVVSAERNVKGKPEPDIFTEAAGELQTDNDKAIVVEDAISGVEAGRKGKFGMVIGINPENKKTDLLANGADIVVKSLKEVHLFSGDYDSPYFTQHIPSALSNGNDIYDMAANKKIALFFDYDGTLTPIVKQPEDAKLDDDMKETIRQLTNNFPVAIVSGRDLRDVQNLVGLDNLYYAGSHGYHIEGPEGMYMENEKASALLHVLDETEEYLRNTVEKNIKGSKIDRKKFAIAVHYRNVDAGEEEKVKDQVYSIAKKNKKLKVGSGKKILELKPAINWDKGKAVYWLLNKLGLDISTTMPMYMGDDITDEDAFRAIANDGIGILVGEHDEPSAAAYHLNDQEEVRLFLNHLINNIKV